MWVKKGIRARSKEGVGRADLLSHLTLWREHNNLTKLSFK